MGHNAIMDFTSKPEATQTMANHIKKEPVKVLEIDPLPEASITTPSTTIVKIAHYGMLSQNSDVFTWRNFASNRRSMIRYFCRLKLVFRKT
uniref:Uncharacterized protein n=1 Tax=Candidatus Kentrum sp. LPFa TaxID=2126335 RepID=A0A450VX73_9GAMM|nr:MAG: hypothetical protein BECKLPF1236B_GA0070989_100826 [Candidatus Kentron sp. LPFa]